MEKVKQENLILKSMNALPTPSYVIDEARLVGNLQILHRVEQEAGCRILLAQKAFSIYQLYPLIGRYISGTTASGLYEARLGHEEMGKETHVYSPAYKEADMVELAQICDHIVFNSLAQLEKYKDICPKGGVGIRINPECSTQGDAADGIYDPCAPGSRLGVPKAALREGTAHTAFCEDEQRVALCEDEQYAALREDEQHAALREGLPKGVSGLHFHTLCEQNFDALDTTVRTVEEQFGEYLRSDQIKWLNMGGGHHITRNDYDVEALIRCIRRIRETYDVEVYLEPGEAVALNAGYLVTEVLDIVQNGQVTNLILDASAACHMPDVLEMPYRPPLQGGYPAGEKPYTYRLSSYTCLAGDIIGEYSFEQPISVGDRLVFEDMAIYTIVKNNTFNGIPLPSIVLMHEDGECEMLRSFGYEDFKGRL